MIGERWILAIADDLTGALETGSKFAAEGLSARVVTAESVVRRPDVSVLVFDTESRHSSAGEAAAKVRKVALSARTHQPWLVYKKTDSTLRGNIAAECAALREVFPERPLVYVPAYPEMGRTVCGGQLLVQGVPVHQTVFAADCLNPVSSSDVAALLGDVVATVVDGESAADVVNAATAIVSSDPPPVSAGPAALAGAFAGLLGRAAPIEWPRVERCLVVNGSRHPASAAQIEFARSHGCFVDGWRLLEHDARGAGIERALATGEHVRALALGLDAMIVFGGDTAFGIHKAFGAPPFEPYRDILPGVPLSRCGDLYWITKAGGFGPPEILRDIRRILT